MQDGEYGYISYKKLFVVMERKKIKKIDLRVKYGIHAATISRLVKDESVNIEVVAQLCEILNCQPMHIMEHIKACEDQRPKPPSKKKGSE